MDSQQLSDRSVVFRAFQILEAFRDEIQEFSLADLARVTGLPKSTLHRLCSHLVSVGALDRLHDTYRLGARLFELARLVPFHRRLREAALPFMIDLHEATRQVVHLGIMDGTQVLYVERIAGHHSTGCPTHVGGRMPLHCTGLGKAMLAFADDPGLVSQVLSGGLRRLTPYTITVPDVLLEALEETREAGVAFDREETKLGLACVSAPIVANSRVIGALSIAGHDLGRPLERQAGAVQTAAISLSRALTGTAIR
jgi:IclR family transcriptional regulator, acetate operon repressor